MNTERILELATVIESLPHVSPDERATEVPLDSFNMEKWHCGSVGCIAGWAVKLFGGEIPDPALSGQQALGLRGDIADDLFTPAYGYGDYHKITPRDAAKVLRKLAETGHVDWSIAASVQS